MSLSQRLDDSTVRAMTDRARELEKDGWAALAQLILDVAGRDDELDRLISAYELAVTTYSRYLAFKSEWGC
jgi:hypothetical protein